MIKCVVFDLGGTLMEYKGMPNSWVDYYEAGFNTINTELNLNLLADDINKSCEILKLFNPRVKSRENELSPEYIFEQVTKHWNRSIDLKQAIDEFFSGIKLEAVIYEESIPLLRKLKADGYKTACLTDLPTAMPDELFKKHIPELLSELDLYMSSLTCGFRKPNKYGLAYIAEHFGLSIDEIIFIGDEEKDMETAKNAGCRGVGAGGEKSEIGFRNIIDSYLYV